MRKKAFKRMEKNVHKINKSALGTDIEILRLLPLALQSNYNPKLKEWYGPKQWEVIAKTKGDMTAFKESEEWKEIGMLGLHDYKITINDNLGIDKEKITDMSARTVKDGRLFEIIFYREFIGEVHIGLRPVTNNEL